MLRRSGSWLRHFLAYLMRCIPLSLEDTKPSSTRRPPCVSNLFKSIVFTALVASYKLYGYPLTHSTQRAMIAFREKGLDFDLVKVDVFAGEQKGAEHLKHHPFGKIPVMVCTSTLLLVHILLSCSG